MKAALLFGLNYAQCESGELRGCHNDIVNLQRYLTSQCNYTEEEVKAFNDQDHKDQTSAEGILLTIYNLAKRTLSEDISDCFISYSGHGTQVRDQGAEEADGKDECLVPWDYGTNGIIRDDTIKDVLCQFNPNTRVVFVCDACHSGSMIDSRYQYFTNNMGKFEQIEKPIYHSIPCHVIAISGCRDDQTSADAHNVNNESKFTGAFTSCLLQILEDHKDMPIKQLIVDLHQLLREKGFRQRPVISSSKELNGDETFIV